MNPLLTRRNGKRYYKRCHIDYGFICWLADYNALTGKEWRPTTCPAEAFERYTVYKRNCQRNGYANTPVVA